MYAATDTIRTATQIPTIVPTSSTERHYFGNARLYLFELFLSPVQSLEGRRFGITRANRIDPNTAIFQICCPETRERTAALLAAYTLNDRIP